MSVINNTPTAYVYFSISGKEFNPELFKPYFQNAIIQDGIYRNGIKYINFRYNANDINEGLDDTLSLISKQITPFSQQLRELIIENKLYSKFFIVLQNLNSFRSGGVFFNKEFIALLHQLNTQVEIDLYE
ncbi:hypothetical protein [Leeuwenhoekiella sp. H156]|uniref:hypothetical protein n=1 Tax=Leeuwenhoekiella sp. H156 TaxID=3450128 RepID=UPI003FA47A3C